MQIGVCAHNKYLFFFLSFLLSKVLFPTLAFEFVDVPAHLSYWLFHLNHYVFQTNPSKPQCQSVITFNSKFYFIYTFIQKSQQF